MDAAAACLPGGKGANCPRSTIVAIGGYGRGELNPYSDVDILFLHDFAAGRGAGRRSTNSSNRCSTRCGTSGSRSGIATRSIREACEHANEDNISKTALIESRHLAGPYTLFAEFRQRFEEAPACRARRPLTSPGGLEDQRVRHQKYGPTVFLQEPNIKSSPGGLRDYHNLLWSLYSKKRVRNLAELSEQRLINESERRTLERAYDFLLRVRTDLHYLTRRSTDSLTLHFQGQIADRFQYPQKNHPTAQRGVHAGLLPSCPRDLC